MAHRPARRTRRASPSIRAPHGSGGHKTPAVSRAAQAVISYQSTNYDIDGAVVGRLSASEGFLRGYVRHGGADPFVCFSTTPSDIRAFRRYVGKHAPGGVLSQGLLPTELRKIASTGTLYVPGPDFAYLAWLRRGYGQRSFSICGVNHTLSEAAAVEAVGQFLISPVQPWDALVCTSTFSKRVILRVLDEYSAYMAQLTGKNLKVPLQLPQIPLGVDCAAMAPREGEAAVRAQQRARLGIPDDEIVLLYFGRFNHVEKANPAPMYIAAQRAAERTGKRIRMLQVGQFASERVACGFREAAAALSPHVRHQFLDGSVPRNLRAWFAADIFVSLSDNVQESFGLTVIEAMAAGLPVVVSDWSGYRDSVRDGIDGFRIPTIMPPPGMGEALAFIYAAGYAPYDTMVGAAAQVTAVHPMAAADALVKLIEDSKLRRRMGASGRARARELFDWSVIIRAYQRLWADLAVIRKSAREAVPPRGNRPPRPLAMDPFTLFREFSTRSLEAETRIALAPGASVATARQMARLAVTVPVRSILLDSAEIAHLVRQLKKRPDTLQKLIRGFPSHRRQAAWYTVGWLCKTGLAQWD
jgi:starch synthase